MDIQCIDIASNFFKASTRSVYEKRLLKLRKGGAAVEKLHKPRTKYSK